MKKKGTKEQLSTVLITRPESEAGDRAQPARLVVIQGPELGTQFALEGDGFVIGRASDADIRLTAAGISRQHCELKRSKGGFLIKDLNSTNHTRVNESVVERASLADGDRIRLGQTVLKYIAADTPEAAYHARLLRDGQRDPDSGLHVIGHFQTQLQALIQQATDSPEGVHGGVLHIALDKPAELRELTGVAGTGKLLARLGERISRALGDDTLIARFGEFRVVALTRTESAEALAQQAEKLRAEIVARVLDLGEGEVAVTASIGVCPFSLRIGEANSMLIGAARSAEQAQAEGGNRCRFYEPRVAAGNSSDDLAVLALLTEALRKNTIQLLFQPAVSTGDESLAHYQLLPRLLTDDDELIPAARFVPVAEAQGKVRDLDLWMSVRALKILREHLGQNRQMRLFVSQAGASLGDRLRFETLTRDLEKPLTEQRLLVFEFRQADVLKRIKEARELMPRLRELGLGVSIAEVGDDVDPDLLLGHFSADYFKLTPRYARAIGRDAELTRRFEQLADQAHGAGARLIVPHVEDAETMGRLWASRADLLQGNFIQQPMQTPDFSL